MFEIIFYKDENGCEPVKDYIMGLKENLQNKDSRIKIHKITEYMKILNSTQAIKCEIIGRVTSKKDKYIVLE